MEYPIDCVTPVERTRYLYRALELLQRLHNVFVEWREKGLESHVWNWMPEKIKQAYPYQFKIDMDIWKKFRDQEFLPRSELIQEEILKQRQITKQAGKVSVEWDIDVGEIKKFVRT